MSGQREVATSPAQPLSEERSSSRSLASEDEIPIPQLHEDFVDSLVDAVSQGHTPSSTPVKPYRFSDHIHRDRHIFLKGASVGIGSSSAGEAPHTGLYPPWVCADHEALPDWSGLLPWGGGAVRRADCSVDRHGNLFYRGRCVQLGHMALGDQRLPSLHRVQLGLTSGDRSRSRYPSRFPHLHEQYRPANRRRPFNEQLNTYVDTQKRIRSVQCVDDLYRASPSTVFPFLSTPTPTPKQPRPPPRPAKIRMAVPRPAIQSLDRQATSLQQQATRGPARAGDGDTASGAPPQNVSEGSGSAREHEDLEIALEEARIALQRGRQSSSDRDYARYFLAKEGGEGTLGRLFQSYPKRMLVIHPGRMMRQRTEIVRSRTNMLQ